MTGNDRAGVAAAQKTVLRSAVVMPGIRLMISFFLVLWIAISCSSEKSNPQANPPAPPDEAAALNAIKEINRAQSDFIRRTRRYAQRTDELIAEHLLSAQPTAAGYTLLMLPSADAVRYTVKATPDAAEARHFFTDQTGVIRAERVNPPQPKVPTVSGQGTASRSSAFWDIRTLEAEGLAPGSEAYEPPGLVNLW